MKNEEKPLTVNNHYPFQYIEETVITYVFLTDTSVKYEVKFKHSPYIFSEEFLFISMCLSLLFYWFQNQMAIQKLHQTRLSLLPLLPF